MTAERLTKGVVMGILTTRAFTPARVALVISAMLVAGLVFIRFASQPDTVSCGRGGGGRPGP